MKKVLCGFLCLVLCAVTFGCDNYQYWHMQTSVFFNINFEVDMIGQNKAEVYNKMLEVMDELNRQINVNVEDVDILATGNNPSDLLRLNLAAADEVVKIGYHAYYLLGVSKEMYALTNGAFNAAAYPLAYLWGVDAVSCQYFNTVFDYDGAPVPPSFKNSSIRPQFKPSKEQVQEVMAYCDLNGLEIWEENGEYYARKNIKELMLDLGAVAKGYAADLCAEICAEYDIESAFINISGNIFMFGKFHDGKWFDHWEIGLREPKTYSSNILCKFECEQNSTAVTSGNYERTRYLVNDMAEAEGKTGDELLALLQYAPHIIDSNRGVPYTLEIVENNDGGWDYFNTQSHVVSATILGANSMYADCFSTAVCVMGLDAAATFLADLDEEFGVKALIFASDMRYANIGGITLIETGKHNGYKNYQPLV